MKYFFQRVEKELQEKAEAAQLPAKREAGDGGETGASSERHKREAGDGVETEPSPAQPTQAAANNQQFSFQLPDQPGLASNNNVNTETVIQNINNLSLTGMIKPMIHK